MTGKTILILGARVAQMPAFVEARNMGLKIITIDPDVKSVGLPQADDAYIFDLADYANCVSVAKKHGVDGCMTLAADYPLITVAKICEELGLCGISMSAAEKATDKYAMRRALKSANVHAPSSVPVYSGEDAVSICSQADYDIVVKPAMSQASRGITLVRSDAGRKEVIEAYDSAKRESRNGIVLMEQYVSGSEFSVESLTWSGHTRVVAVTDKLTSGPPYFVELMHSQPSRLPTVEAEKLVKAAASGIRALGIDNSASHTEVILGSGGASIIEIGARLGGGFITSHLVPLSTGVNMVRSAILVALGEEPHVEVEEGCGAATRFMTAPAGIIKRIDGIDSARGIEGLREITLYAKEGDEVMPLRDARGRLGHVVCTGGTAKEAIERANHAVSLVSIQTC